MSQTVLICPKCSGEMALGCVKDRSDAHSYKRIWIRKMPDDTSWSSDAIPFKFEGYTRPTDKVLIGTYRCESCGYLESYARHEFED